LLGLSLVVLADLAPKAAAAEAQIAPGMARVWFLRPAGSSMMLPGCLLA
jgi:hypothetical protein